MIEFVDNAVDPQRYGQRIFYRTKSKSNIKKSQEQMTDDVLIDFYTWTGTLEGLMQCLTRQLVDAEIHVVIGPRSVRAEGRIVARSSTDSDSARDLLRRIEETARTIANSFADPFKINASFSQTCQIPDN